MIVKIDGATYRVGWNYERWSNGGKLVAVSRCFINRVDGTNVELVIQADAECVKPDNFDRAFGRRLTFERAVSRAFCHSSEVNYRRAFWQQFTSECKMPAKRR